MEIISSPSKGRNRGAKAVNSPAATGRVLHGPDPTEFSLVADGVTYSGKDPWELIGMTPLHAGEGAGATLSLRSTKGPTQLRVDLDYLLYPDLAVVRKRLRVVNEGAEPVRLESVDVEVLTAQWN